jgi:hypothetical protein
MIQIQSFQELTMMGHVIDTAGFIGVDTNEQLVLEERYREETRARANMEWALEDLGSKSELTLAKTFSRA